jgi:hypothetical protein
MICGAVKLKRIEVGATNPAETFGVFPPEELQLFFSGSDVKQVDRFASPDAGKVRRRSGWFKPRPFESFHLERFKFTKHFKNKTLHCLSNWRTSSYFATALPMPP